MAKHEVYVEIDLSEFDDDEIRDEFDQRGLHEKRVLASDRDFRLLADLIAAGETNEALSLLHTLSKAAFPLNLVKKLATVNHLFA